MLQGIREWTPAELAKGLQESRELVAAIRAEMRRRHKLAIRTDRSDGLSRVVEVVQRLERASIVQVCAEMPGVKHDAVRAWLRSANAAGLLWSRGSEYFWRPTDAD